MKYLIVSGDSCTEPYFYSAVHPDLDFEYPKWPDFVGEHLGMQVLNLARGGSGNEFIYSSLQDILLEIPKEEIGLIIAGWTQSHREDWEVGRREHYPYKDFATSPWKSQRVASNGNLVHFVRKSLRTYIAFQNLCENNNLPYYHFQMGDLFERVLFGLKPTENETLRGIDYTIKYPEEMFNADGNKILKLLRKYQPYMKNFMGYPGISEEAQLRLKAENHLPWPFENYPFGYTMHSKVLGYDKAAQVKKGLIISEKDDHPNAKGHKAIADFIIQNLKL
tara:strand:+ start:220 stop:1053 length:834 start_codon:yes stop_codon:yes gene_type:complete